MSLRHSTDSPNPSRPAGSSLEPDRRMRTAFTSRIPATIRTPMIASPRQPSSCEEHSYQHRSTVDDPPCRLAGTELHHAHTFATVWAAERIGKAGKRQRDRAIAHRAVRLTVHVRSV